MTKYSLALALLALLASPVEAQHRIIKNLVLVEGGFAHFGDEDYDDLPFFVELTLDAIPAGTRELVQLGPLNLTLALGQVEMRVDLANGGEAFTSRSAAAFERIRGDVTAISAVLTTGTGSTALPIPPAAPDPGVFTLGVGPGPELRVLTFKSQGARTIFFDGFESGDTSAWSCAGSDLDCP